MKYSFKLLDICNFVKGSLPDLSKNLSDKDKIITKIRFPDNFELLKKKVCFPYEWLTFLLYQRLSFLLYQRLFCVILTLSTFVLRQYFLNSF